MYVSVRLKLFVYITSEKIGFREKAVYLIFCNFFSKNSGENEFLEVYYTYIPQTCSEKILVIKHIIY